MAKDPSLFRGHGEGEGAGAAAGGGAGEERADAGSSATGFISLNIFFIPVEIIVSQGYCESRPTIYDPRANSVLSVFKIF